jgi:hypothetical protein
MLNNTVIEQSTAFPGKYVVLEGDYICFVGTYRQCVNYINIECVVLQFQPRAVASRVCSIINNIHSKILTIVSIIRTRVREAGNR